MISALLVTALLQTALTQSEEATVVIDPPVGTLGNFQSLAVQVRKASQTDPGKAARLASLLPRRNPAIYWDDRKVPAVSRVAFRQARDYAIAEWSRMVTDLKPVLVKTPSEAARGIAFSFEPSLAKGAAAANFLDSDTTKPRLEAVLGLRRGDYFTGEIDVHNEVLFSIGTYLGILPNPAFGGALGRTDVRAAAATTPRSGEARIAREALDYAAGLREAVGKRKPLDAKTPKLWVESKSLDLGTHLQGERVDTSFSVSNNGTGTLMLAAFGDCGCLSAVGPTVLKPGESGVVRASYDTSALGGKIAHRVLIRSTDPDVPDTAVTLNVAVRTLARFIVPGGLTVAPADGAPVELFLVTDESKPLTLRASRLDGIEGTLDVQPWSGTLADATLGEGPLPRSGYRVRVFPKSIRPGIALAVVTLTPTEGDPIVGNVFIQRGIVANPPAIGFVDPGTTPGRVEFTLTQPGKPFGILSVRAEGRGLAASVVRPGAPMDRHTVAVTLDPAALLKGETRRVIIRTDDLVRPEIVVPIIIPEE